MARSGLGSALLVPVLAACLSPGPRLADDEISDRGLWLPEGARAGMFVTWRHEGDGPVAVTTLACVAETADTVTMEERETSRDGSTTVTAARFSRDGAMLRAWRGSGGGPGTPLRIVPSKSVEEMGAEADRAARAIGASTKDAKARTETTRETIDTPAGPFECDVRRIRVSMLFASGETATWWARTPLPLTRAVKIEERGPGSYRRVELLEAYGRRGAKPTLRIPD